MMRAVTFFGFLFLTRAIEKLSLTQPDPLADGDMKFLAGVMIVLFFIDIYEVLSK